MNSTIATKCLHKPTKHAQTGCWCSHALCISILRFSLMSTYLVGIPPVHLQFPFRSSLGSFLPCVPKSDPLNILHQQPQICSDLNKILHTQDDICYKHYYMVSYKSALTLLKYDVRRRPLSVFVVCRPGRINLL